MKVSRLRDLHIFIITPIMSGGVAVWLDEDERLLMCVFLNEEGYLEGCGVCGSVQRGMTAL